jgi:catechol-2,3-dioxygenase
MAIRKLYPPGLYGVHLQVRDLDRSVSFYQNMLGLEVAWKDSALAVLLGPQDRGDTLVLREIGESARAPHAGEAGVTRLFWRIGDPAGLDDTEDRLIRHSVPYVRHREGEILGISAHDPDGINIVVVPPDQPLPDGTPPSVAYWKH